MTRKQIDHLIRVHESQRDFVKSYLDRHYYDLEDDDKETEWLNRYLYHKRIVDELKQQQADDE